MKGDTLMNLRLKRKDNNGLEGAITSLENLGLIIVCQRTTKTEHKKLLNQIETCLGEEVDIDIFYDWKTSSIFIIDTDNFGNQVQQKLRNSLGKTRYAIVYKGNHLKRFNTLTELYVNIINGKLTIGKQFAQLLSIDSKDDGNNA